MIRKDRIYRNFFTRMFTGGRWYFEQKQRIVQGGGVAGDYLFEYPKWLEAQDGKNINPADNYTGTPADTRYIVTPRDIAYYVHVDALYEAYLHAALILLQHNAPVDSGNPYISSQTQIGFGTFGGPHILSLVTEVATRALKAVWYQKWFVHRRLRPEAFGGLIHRMKNTVSPPSVPNPQYAIHNEILNSQVLPRIFAIYNWYLLPQAFPEGSPTHPSYGAGHATVAGACVTILKAWFNEDTKIKDLFDPVMPDPADDTNLTTVGVPDSATITVGGELNKVAANVAIGRNWAGVHYRSDYKESLELGEKIAIDILEEQKITYNEKSSFKIKKFDGTSITI